MAVSRFWRLAAGIGLLLALCSPVVEAQEGDIPTLSMMETVFGTINDDATEARWQFTAQAGDEIAALVQALSGDLDPYLQVIDDTGRMVAESDDIAYPDNLNAALEAVEIAHDGVYTLVVTRFGFERGASQGDFALTLLPAYANPLLWESFSGELEWTANGSELVEVEAVDGRLRVTPSANNALVWATPMEAIQLPQRAYLQAAVLVENAPDYWEYGLVFRQTSPTSYYLFAVSSRGDWVFLARAGPSTWLHLQDWTEHPALRDPPSPSLLGVLMDGDQFTFYFNGVELATLTATEHAGPGGIAVSAGTVDQQDVMPVIGFDHVLATGPLPPTAPVNEVAAAPLAGWESGDAEPVIAELVAQGLIAEGGRQVMLVPDSFTTTSRPGIQDLSLGQGRRQIDLVMGTTILPESDSAENGCGLTFRREGDGHYSLFFLDGVGGYGLAEWVSDRFDPAFYDLRDATGNSEGDHVVLVAQGDRVRVYLNGQPLLVQANPPVDGTVGIAALSYDGTFVNCQFRDTWLWTWE